MSNEKIPPQSLDAEQSLLGALLIDKQAINGIVELIHAESFYRESHKFIFEAILELSSRNEPIDMITVSDVLKKKGQLDMVGGRVYLSDLANSVISSAHIEHYAKIVESKYILRTIISAGGEMIGSAFDHDGEPGDILQQAQKIIFELSQRNLKQGFAPIKTILDEVMDDIDKNYDKPGMSGVPSHFVDLDQITNGFQASDMIILAARPSMGKTAFALNVATNLAIKEKLPVGIFSLEMAKESLVQRMLCSEAEIDASRLKSKNLQDFEWKKIARAVSRLSEAKVFIDDSSSITILELQAKARRLKAEHDVRLLIIDFLTLIKGSQKRPESRYHEISEIARMLKAMAKELRIPVIVISQLNRSIEQRHDQLPKMSDLRESGEIEQMADLILFVHRPSYYDSSMGEDNSAQIIVAKHRNGRTGIADLTFRREITKFVNKSREEVPVDVGAPL
jgi:replicative DNA helicase